MKPVYTFCAILFFWQLAGSCTKSAFLDKKPTTSLVIPSSLAELRSLLDNTNVFTLSPGLGEISADNYYLSFAEWQAQTQLEQNAYSWEKDLYGANRKVSDWSILYQQVLYANIVLEQLAKLTPTPSESAEWNDLRGSALFLRTYAFCNLVQHFAPAYDSATATTDAGIPLRTEAAIHRLYPRASLQDCYNLMYADLTEAAGLLPASLPANARNRPSRPAAYALLSRMAINTRAYEKAGKYADSCLALYDKLIDYNSISPTAVTPFPRIHDESLYYCQANSEFNILITISTTVFADSLLYRSYAANDLRKAVFFRSVGGGKVGFKRGYGGTVLAFTGLATDEVYLNRAESFARMGNAAAAMNDLNTLLVKRWKNGTYVPLTASTPTDALHKILTERRKELVWRGIRWTDLKRLNKEGASITLTRLLNGQVFTLLPNSPLYVFPIPGDEIGISGISQNPR